MSGFLRVAACVLTVCACASGLRAQQPATDSAKAAARPGVRPDTAQATARPGVRLDSTRAKEKPFSPADTVAAALASKQLTPGRAFVRSLLVPGWGQFSAGAKVRGTVYVVLQGTSMFMLVKTQLKINDAYKLRADLRQAGIDSLRAGALASEDTALIRKYADPDSVRIAAEGLPDVASKGRLIHARHKQREDWVTQFVFFTFASAVDAFVGAHLAEFPGTATATPTPAGMRVDMQVHLPLGGRAPRWPPPLRAP